MMISFGIEYPERPWTTNAERSGNRWDRAKKTKQWRTAYALLATELAPPRLEWCDVIVEPWLRNRAGVQDTGACHPAAKAAIDGLVDAGVLDDDTPDIVRSITYLAPKIGRDALVLIIEGETKL
jgi:hypothetical protein